jgi:hypothetical protein
MPKKVKMLRSLAGSRESFTAGQVYELDDDFAEALAAGPNAELVDNPSRSSDESTGKKTRATRTREPTEKRGS